MLHIFYLNVRGLRSKVNDFYNNVCTCQSDVIVLTESWLNNDIFDSGIFPNNFIVYRHDRRLLQLGMTRGGGVLIGVRNSFRSCAINLSHITEVLPSIDLLGVTKIGRKLFAQNFPRS